MASATGGGPEFWLTLTLIELIAWIKDAQEAQKEDEQARKQAEGVG